MQGAVQWEVQSATSLDTFMQKVSDALCNQISLAAPTTSGSTNAASVQTNSATTVGTNAAPTHSVSSNSFFSQLSSLMVWRDQGLLSDVEFAAAKQRLGLC